jgi:hypothetical protein
MEDTAFNGVHIEQFTDSFMSVCGVIFPGLTGFTSRVLHYFQRYYSFPFVIVTSFVILLHYEILKYLIYQLVLV